MREERVAPAKVQSIMSKEMGESAPTMRQIYWMNRQVDQKNGLKFKNLGQLSDWLHNNSGQHDDNDPFILDYIHSDMNDDDVQFQYVMSTPKLLRTALKFKIVAADGTYKINEHDYPLIVVGGIDINQHFHVLAFSGTTKEEGKNYKYVFQTMKNAIWSLFHKQWSPNVIVTDAAGAISNGFRDAFPETETRNVMCWAHCVRAIRQKLGKGVNHEALMDDIYEIHRSHSPEVFAQSVMLFLAKWCERVPKFCQYFERFWVKLHPGWYLGFADNCPSTNNGAEGYNRSIKENYTFRILLPLGELNQKLFEVLNKRSIKNISVPQEKEISDELWIAANQWFNDDVPTVSFGGNITQSVSYIASSECRSRPTKEAIAHYDDLIATNFDDFRKLMRSMWKLTFNRLDWEKSSCTCPVWIDKGICKHVVGTAIALKLVSVPAKLNQLPLRQPTKRKPNTKAAKALTIQPYYDRGQQTISKSLTRSDPMIAISDQSETLISVVTRSNSQPLPSIHEPNSDIDLGQSLQFPSMQFSSSSTNENIQFRAPISSSRATVIPSISISQPLTTAATAISTNNDENHAAEFNANDDQNQKRTQRTLALPKSLPTKQNRAPPTGSLIILGDFGKQKHIYGQYMCMDSMTWSELPPIGTPKTTVANASFTYIGQNRIIQTGGVERQHLKRVNFFNFQSLVRSIFT